MQRKKSYRRLLLAALIINLFFIGYGLVHVYNSRLPNSIKVMAGKEANFDFNVPASAVIRAKTDNTSVVNHQKVYLNQPFTITSESTGSFEVNVKLWDMIYLKKVKLDIIEKQKVIPCGNQVGIFIETDGVLVLDTQVITSVDGLNCEPSKNLLKSGDYIQKVNNNKIDSKEELSTMVAKEGSTPVVLEILRDKRKQKVKIEPVKAKSDNTYKLGVWVRDDTQGIGTLTFINGNDFGALGHGIHDIDTGNMMDVDGGYIFDANILSLVKGKNGQPGEIVGMVNYDYENPFGSIEKNTTYGIYGTINKKSIKNINKEEVDIGLKQEVKPGKAYIRSSIDGTSKDYEIQIESVDVTNKNYAKGMVIRITDKRLLKLTNGIIQGMSGTPILQNGKLIGAVTHVFIQDSTKGYGTFIENMLKESYNAKN